MPCAMLSSVSEHSTPTASCCAPCAALLLRRHEVDESKQVDMGPLRQDPVVAIIGGGMSGLACAHELARQVGTA